MGRLMSWIYYFISQFVYIKNNKISINYNYYVRIQREFQLKIKAISAVIYVSPAFTRASRTTISLTPLKITPTIRESVAHVT